MGRLFCRPDAGKLVVSGVFVILVAGILVSALSMLSSLYTPGFYGAGSFFAPFGVFSSSPASSDIDVINESNSSIPASVNRTSPSTNLPDNMKTRPIWKVPTDNKFPDLNEFGLTKEMVKSRAKDNVIIVTFGNYAFMDFIVNWVKHLTDLNVHNLLVGAMDKKVLKSLYWKGVPVFDMGSNMVTEDPGWGSPAFHKMGREKVYLINSLLPFGYELLMCDTDMVWLKNPLPYLARFPDADILTSSDQVVPTVTDDRLEVWTQVTGAYNIGIFHWRPTDASKRLAEDWKVLLQSDDTIWDQNGFNDLARKVLGPSVGDEVGLFYAYDGKLKLGVLPASIFCNGHTYFVQGIHQQLRLEPYAVHTTFQYGGTDGKRHRLREAMLFFDQPEYYESRGGFLSFRPNIPKNLLLEGAHTVESHFKLVNYQLKQIRTALAIASLLGRALIMPPIWCRLDRLWYGHPGVLEGTMTRQPFLCPMDHVFEVNNMLSNFPEPEFGPRIYFREYSFLQNPSVPMHVKQSVLEVHIYDEQSTNSSESTSKPGSVFLPRNSTEHELVRLLSPYKKSKIIDFSSMVDAFQGFANPERERKFRQRVKRYVGIWCCVQFQEIGHIYYDMYWDEKPGWTPKPPQTREEDHPPY